MAAVTTMSKEMFLQSMGGAYDKAAVKGTADQFADYMLAASVHFNQPAPGVLISVDTAMLAETDGTETLAQASDVFTGYLDGDFKAWKTDKQSNPTASQAVTVYEMHEDAPFEKIFTPPDGKTLDDLCLTQAQIKKFCHDYPKKLRQDGYSTLFLFKVDRPEGKNPEYFVARVDVSGRELEANVSRFDYPSTWSADARRRVVVPQLQV